MEISSFFCDIKQAAPPVLSRTTLAELNVVPTFGFVDHKWEQQTKVDPQLAVPTPGKPLPVLAPRWGNRAIFKSTFIVIDNHDHWKIGSLILKSEDVI